MRWGIDGFQGERKKDHSSLIKYISGLNKIGGKFPANEWVFLKILQSLIRGWGEGGGSVKSLNAAPSPKETNQQTLSLIDLILLYLDLDFTR